MNKVTDQRNIVLVTIDSLRMDHCGFGGYDHNTTPNLDALAADGICFENAIAPGPSTSESVPAIVTGEYPFDRGKNAADIDDRIARIRPHLKARRTMAERLSERGYTTAAFTPNPFTSRYFGYNEGFDYFEDFLDGSRDLIYQRLLKGMKESRYYLPLRILLNWFQGEEAFKPWDAFYDDVIDWANKTDRPYFIWIFLMDVHHPYLADRQHRNQSVLKSYYANWELRRKDYDLDEKSRAHNWLLQAYDDSIRYADTFIGQLRDDLADDDPVLTITADHGEAFGEHGAYEHHGGAFGQEGEQEYNSYLYEENVHVPLVISNYRDSNTIKEPLSLTQLPAMLERIADGRVFEGLTSDFVSSKTMSDQKVAARGERFKAIQTAAGIEIYDLDKNEDNPISDHHLAEAFDEYISGIKGTTAEKERLSQRAKEFAAETTT
jgi:arylsulfatase